MFVDRYVKVLRFTWQPCLGRDDPARLVERTTLEVVERRRSRLHGAPLGIHEVNEGLFLTARDQARCTGLRTAGVARVCCGNSNSDATTASLCTLRRHGPTARRCTPPRSSSSDHTSQPRGASARSLGTSTGRIGRRVALQRLAKKHPPLKSTDVPNGLLNASRRFFGTWEQICAAAGVEGLDHVPPGYWTRERIIEELRPRAHKRPVAGVKIGKPSRRRLAPVRGAGRRARGSVNGDRVVRKNTSLSSSGSLPAICSVAIRALSGPRARSTKSQAMDSQGHHLATRIRGANRPRFRPTWSQGREVA